MVLIFLRFTFSLPRLHFFFEITRYYILNYGPPELPVRLQVLFEHARIHVKEKHGMEPSDKELESEIKEV